MKKLFLFTFIAFFSSLLYAQNPNSSEIKKVIKLDEKAQVRDAAGMEYPYAVWKKLSGTGKYSFKLIDGKNSETPIFMIFELSPQEIEARRERMPKPMASKAFVLAPIKQEYSFKFRLLIKRLIFSLKSGVANGSISPLG
jgi:hypothetical protein